MTQQVWPGVTSAASGPVASIRRSRRRRVRHGSRGATKNRSGPRAGSSLGAVLTFVCLGQFMVFIDVSIVNLGLPSIQQALGMSDVSLNYVVTAYATVLGGFLLLGGRLADTLGRRRVLQAGLATFAAASLVSGLAYNGAPRWSPPAASKASVRRWSPRPRCRS